MRTKGEPPVRHRTAPRAAAPASTTKFYGDVSFKQEVVMTDGTARKGKEQVGVCVRVWECDAVQGMAQPQWTQGASLTEQQARPWPTLLASHPHRVLHHSPPSRPPPPTSTMTRLRAAAAAHRHTALQGVPCSLS